MPKIQPETIALLARLSLSESERVTFARQLDEVLVYAERIQALDTEHVEPTSHALLRQDVFREDRPVEGLSREEALEMAPEDGEGLFKVPRIIP